jgi:Phospholipase D Active site motif
MTCCSATGCSCLLSLEGSGSRPRAGPRDQFAAWAEASIDPPIYSTPIPVSHLPTHEQCAPLLADLNQQLSAATLYYAPDFSYWTVGADAIPAAQHAKIYIIDDTHFYVGSDNVYTSGYVQGLQEYGHLIEGQTETTDFISNYWTSFGRTQASTARKRRTRNTSATRRSPHRRVDSVELSPNSPEAQSGQSTSPGRAALLPGPVLTA